MPTQSLPIYFKGEVDKGFAPRNAAWKPSRAYVVGDLVTNGGTLYQCATAHTSGTTFSSTNWTAIASGSGGGGSTGTAPTINTQTGTTYTPVLSDGDNALVLLSNAASIAVTLPANGAVGYPLGSTIQFKQGAAGLVTVAGGSGVTCTPTSVTTAGPGQEIWATKVGTDTWQLIVLGATGSTTTGSMVAIDLGSTITMGSGNTQVTGLTEQAGDSVNSAGLFTIGTNQITVNYTGQLWVISAMHFVTGGSGERDLLIYKNGNPIRQTGLAAVGRTSYTEKIKCTTGDVFQLWFWSAVSGAQVQGFGDYSTFLKLASA